MPNQVMDVVAKPAAGSGSEPMAKAPPEKNPLSQEQLPPAHQKAPAKPKPAKQPGSGVTAAIFATVIIVLGLALLAVYAYTKQNK